MLSFVLAVVLTLAFAQSSAEQSSDNAEEYRKQAIELNSMAGAIRSEADARKLIDTLAEIFAKRLPPPWATTAIRERLAHAEYQAVSDSPQLIPEERVTSVWNDYVRAVGAPEETLVTATEIHWLRDAHFSLGQRAWARGGYETFWNIPNIYAVGSDGKLAGGCRALEVLRIIWDLDNAFVNVRSAREGIRKGILVSARVRQQMEKPDTANTRFEARAGIRIDPVGPAERRYIQEHGLANYYLLLDKLFNELFPS